MIGYYNYTVILTYIGTIFGFIGITYTFNNNLKLALICLMISGFCDMFDGKIASTMKRSKAEKRFGIQIDSLSDLICFGVLPSLLVLRLTKGELIYVAITVMYLLCALVRLAWFNVDEEERQEKEDCTRDTYLGLPVTTSALILPLIVGSVGLLKLPVDRIAPWVLLFVAVAFIAAHYFFGKGKETLCDVKGKVRTFFFGKKAEEEQAYGPILYTLLCLAFTGFLMFLTLKVIDNSIYVGYSVFSDFAPHLGMIRSFSVSNNFPTQYSHFAGEDVRYHFMFQFMVGNLEYLGLRLDFAFNLPSIFGMVSLYMLLFVFVVRLTKSRLCGYLTAFLFTFRSSFTLFRYMAEQWKGDVWNALKTNTEFLGYTQNENWGLWNLNVYCNQRHLAFAMALLVLALLLFLPYVEQMGEKLKQIKQKEDAGLRVNQIKTLFFTKTAFGVYDIKFAVFMGIILGAMAFWNGSVLVATLAMLFFMAAVSEYRLDYLITAVLALVLYFCQSALFVEGSVVSPAYFFGFLADNKTFWGVLLYIVELTGIVLFVALVGAALVKGVKRYLFFVFLVPFVLAFTLALTVDVTVNHKWIMMSLMLVSMFAAIPLAMTIAYSALLVINAKSYTRKVQKKR